jgi:hypothetical protein
VLRNITHALATEPDFPLLSAQPVQVLSTRSYRHSSNPPSGDAASRFLDRKLRPSNY